MGFFSMLEGLTEAWRGKPPQAPRLPQDWVGGEGSHLPATDAEEGRLGLSQCTEGNLLRLLVCGHEALPAILDAIAQAEHHIHLQSLVFFDDAAGKILVEALRAKARAGVKVRVLFEFLTTAVGDPFFHKGLSPLSVRALVEQMRADGIEVIDSARFPLSLLAHMEVELLLNDLKRWAARERTLAPDGQRQEVARYQEEFIHKAEALLRSSKLQTLLDQAQAMADAVGVPTGWLLTPLRYLRQFLLHDHRKILVIDGRVGFCGGMNIGQEYLYAHPYDPTLPAEEEAQATGNPEPWQKWHDVCVQLEGPSVNGLQRSFVTRWDTLHSGPTDEDAPHNEATHADTWDEVYFPAPARCGPSKVWLLSQIPNQPHAQLRERLLQEIMHAQRSVHLCNPYLIHEAFVGALLHQGHTGREIQLLLPDHHNDSALHQAAMRGCYDWYTDAGIEIHEYQHHFTHAKVLVADDRTHIGSYNFNNRSALLDFECSLLIEDPAFAQEARERIFATPIQAGHTAQKTKSIEALGDIDLTLGAKALLDLFPEVF